MISAYLFLKRNRGRKKRKIYKQAAMISLDATIIFYIVLFIGYILFAIISEGNLLQTVQQQMGFLRDVELREFRYVLLTLPLVYLVSAFRHPGVQFSSTEYKWSLQPVKRIHIWILLAADRWLWRAVIYSLIGLFYGIFSLTPTRDVVLYVLLLLGLNVLMTPIQWKFFQVSIWRKLLYFIAFAVLLGLGMFMPLGVVLAALVVLHIFCLRGLMHDIQWAKVTAAVDYKIWNMMLITQMTKVKFQKPRKHTVWQRLPFVKRPFHYEKNAMYYRLWRLHFEKNWLSLFRLCGVLLIFLFVTVFLKQWLFLVALFVTTQVYIDLMASLFIDRFKDELVAILPWDLPAYRRTFRVGAFSLSSIYLLPLAVYIFMYPSWESTLQVVLFAVFFVLQLLETLNKKMHTLDGKFSYDAFLLQGCAAGMAFAFLSLFHGGFLGLAVVVMVVLLWKSRTRRLF